MKNNFHQLLLKAERFCAYRERCSHEVKQKMKELGADEKETGKIISSLEENDFLNDERFAKLFTSGKFRIKRWGKNKICAVLRMKKIPDHIISKALDTIVEEEYLKMIRYLIKKKKREGRSQSVMTSSEKLEVKRMKIGNYLLSKGYETDLIWQNLQKDS